MRFGRFSRKLGRLEKEVTDGDTVFEDKKKTAYYTGAIARSNIEILKENHEIKEIMKKILKKLR